MPLVKTKFKTMYLVSSKPDNSTSTTVDTYREDDDDNNNNNNNNDDDDLNIESTSGPSSYNCPHCSERFLEIKSLQDHIGINHPDMYTYSCNKCPYKTVNFDEFLNHTESHTRPYDSSSPLPPLSPPSPSPSPPSASSNNLAITDESPPPPPKSITYEDNSSKKQLVLRNSRSRPTPIYYPYPKSDPTTRQKRNIKAIERDRVEQVKPSKTVKTPTANKRKTLAKKKIVNTETLKKGTPLPVVRKRKNVPNYGDDSDDSDYETSSTKKNKYNVGEKRKFVGPMRRTKRVRVTDRDMNQFFVG